MKRILKRVMAAVLSVCVSVPAGAGLINARAEKTETETRVVTSFSQLPESERKRVVETGTEEEDLKLPKTLEVTYITFGSEEAGCEQGYSDDEYPSATPGQADVAAASPFIASPPQIIQGEGIFEKHTKKIMVTWESFPDYDSAEEGEYIFTPVLPEMYVEREDVFLPEIEVTVTERLTDAVKALVKTIDALPSVDSIYENMPGDGDPEFQEWLSGMRAVLKAVREAKEAYDALTEEEKGRLPDSYMEKLMNLVSMMDRLEEMTKLSEGNSWSDFASDSFDGGDGSMNRPYEIRTPEQLAFLSKQTREATKGKYYELTADIDLAGHNWTPCEAFSGNFDGNGKTIENMTCVQSTGTDSGGGLFGRIDGTDAPGENLQIHGVTFTGCQVIDEGNSGVFNIKDSAGILAGRVTQKVDIVDCHVKDSNVIAGGDTEGVGGLAGYVGYDYDNEPAQGAAVGQKIENCSVNNMYIENKSGSIGGIIGQANSGMKSIKDCSIDNIEVYASSNYGAGGLLGYLACGFVDSIISNCRVMGGSVSAEGGKNGHSVGGLIGSIRFIKKYESLKIDSCSTEVEVTGSGKFLGGLVGYAAANAGNLNGKKYFSIENCRSSGDVSGSSEDIGGLVGSMMGNIRNCSASGNVKGRSQVGGWYGRGDNPPAEAVNCHASGNVTGVQEESGSSVKSSGGLIGFAWVIHVQDSYAEGDVNGAGSNYGGLIGRSSRCGLTRCWARGNVTTRAAEAGGFLGYSFYDKIEYCYSTGDVRSEVTSAEPKVGGFIGNGCRSAIMNCYSSGKVAAVAAGLETAAGFIGCCSADSNGNKEITVKNCSYDKEASGQAEGIGTVDAASSISLKAELTTDMRHPNQAYYLNEDGQITVWGWKKGENSDYPYLGEPKITRKLSREAYLTALTVLDGANKPGILTPEFDKDILEYRLQTTKNSVEIRAEAAGKATMKIRRDEGEEEFTGVSVEPLAVGENIIYLDVTAEDEMDVRTYAITVTRKETGVLEGELKGTVTSEGAPVSGVKVEVRIGGSDGELAGRTLTDQNGGYGFSGLKYGVYSVTAAFNGAGRGIVRVAEIDSEETELSIILPAGNEGTAVERKGTDTPPLAAEGLEKLFDPDNTASEDEKGYTEEDRTVVENGGSVEIKLNGERRTENGADSEILKLSSAAGGKVPALILDFTVTKTVKDSAGGQVKQVLLTELPSLIHIVVPIPQELKGKQIKLIRVHNGQAEEISEGSGPEYFIVKGDYIHLYVNKFSLYGFVEPEKPENHTRPAAGSADSSKEVSPGIWKRDEKGWYYLFGRELWASKGWYYLFWNGKYYWYHFDDNGYLDTGWFTDKDGNQYYLHPASDGDQGYMYTGWRQIDGKWHYFEPLAGQIQGRLYKSTVTPDGYVVDEKGVWIEKIVR